MIKERRKGVLEAGEKWVEIVRHGNNPEGDQGPAWNQCWKRSEVPAALHQEQATIPIAQAVGSVPGTMWTDLEKRISSAPTGIRVPNCLACSQSLHRLNYLGPFFMTLLL